MDRVDGFCLSRAPGVLHESMGSYLRYQGSENRLEGFVGVLTKRGLGAGSPCISARWQARALSHNNTFTCSGPNGVVGCTGHALRPDWHATWIHDFKHLGGSALKGSISNVKYPRRSVASGEPFDPDYSPALTTSRGAA
jgi:hypothetical protein